MKDSTLTWTVLAVLFTFLPVFSFFIIKKEAHIRRVFGCNRLFIVSVLGFIWVFFIGYATFFAVPYGLEAGRKESIDQRRAVVKNILETCEDYEECVEKVAEYTKCQEDDCDTIMDKNLGNEEETYDDKTTENIPDNKKSRRKTEKTDSGEIENAESPESGEEDFDEDDEYEEEEEEIEEDYGELPENRNRKEDEEEEIMTVY